MWVWLPVIHWYGGLLPCSVYALICSLENWSCRRLSASRKANRKRWTVRAGHRRLLLIFRQPIMMRTVTFFWRIIFGIGMMRIWRNCRIFFPVSRLTVLKCGWPTNGVIMITPVILWRWRIWERAIFLPVRRGPPNREAIKFRGIVPIICIARWWMFIPPHVISVR